jgi:hypothetical protein
MSFFVVFVFCLLHCCDKHACPVYCAQAGVCCMLLCALQVALRCTFWFGLRFEDVLLRLDTCASMLRRSCLFTLQMCVQEQVKAAKPS